MADTDGPLTLEGLAQVLRDHMNGTAARFAEVGRRIDDLRGEIGIIAAGIRDLGQVVLRQVDRLEEHRQELAEHRREVADQQRQIEEHRQYIRQIFARMEQHDARAAEHDARFEAMTREIRRILDAMERRGGDGGASPQQ